MQWPFYKSTQSRWHLALYGLFLLFSGMLFVMADSYVEYAFSFMAATIAVGDIICFFRSRSPATKARPAPRVS